MIRNEGWSGRRSRFERTAELQPRPSSAVSGTARATYQNLMTSRFFFRLFLSAVKPASVCAAIARSARSAASASARRALESRGRAAGGMTTARTADCDLAPRWSFRVGT